MAGPPLRLYTQEGISARGNGKDRSRGGLSVASVLATEDGEESQRRGLKASRAQITEQARSPDSAEHVGGALGGLSSCDLLLAEVNPVPTQKMCIWHKPVPTGIWGTLFSRTNMFLMNRLYLTHPSSLLVTALVKRILNDQLLSPTRPGPSLWSSTEAGGRGLGTNSQTYGPAARRPDPRSQREIQAEPRLPLLMATRHPPARSPLLAADPGAGDGHRFGCGLPR